MRWRVAVRVRMGDDQGATEAGQGAVEGAAPVQRVGAGEVGHRAVQSGVDPLPEVGHVTAGSPGDDAGHIEAESAGFRDGQVSVNSHATILTPSRTGHAT